MAKLSTKARKALPASKFAGPGRSYPVEDKTHARLAKSGASRAERVGNIGKSTEARIDARADRVLGTAQNDTRAGGAKTAAPAHPRSGMFA